MLTREKNKISYLHFIMSVLVILIHSINNDTKLERFFSIESGIGQFAVPLFFIISGFLYFRNIKSKTDAIEKLKRRVRTLLIPFLLWNLIYYAIHLFLKPGSGISLDEILDSAFTYKYNPAFWFMYQLILLSIISPLIFWFTNQKLPNVFRKKSIIVMAIILLIFAEILISFGIDVPYLNEDAFIYYVSGMILANLYNSGKISLIGKKYTLIFLLLFIVSLHLIDMYIVCSLQMQNIIIHSLLQSLSHEFLERCLSFTYLIFSLAIRRFLILWIKLFSYMLYII